MGGGRMNPDMIFNMMSQGKDYIEISAIRMNRDQAEAYAQRKGITNDDVERIANVDRTVVDAARSLGMTETRVLLKVEVPINAEFVERSSAR